MDKLSFNWSHSSYCFVKLWLNYGSYLLICDWFLVVSFPLRNKTTWKCRAKIKSLWYFVVLLHPDPQHGLEGRCSFFHLWVSAPDAFSHAHSETRDTFLSFKARFRLTGPLLASASKPLPSGTVSKHLSTDMFSFIHLFSALGTASIHSLCLCGFS